VENQKETVKKEDVLETENHIIAERLAKLDKLRAEGVAYPNDFVQKDRIEEVRAANGSKTPSGRNIITFSTKLRKSLKLLRSKSLSPAASCSSASWAKPAS